MTFLISFLWPWMLSAAIIAFMIGWTVSKRIESEK